MFKLSQNVFEHFAKTQRHRVSGVKPSPPENIENLLGLINFERKTNTTYLSHVRNYQCNHQFLILKFLRKQKPDLKGKA